MQRKVMFEKRDSKRRPKKVMDEAYEENFVKRVINAPKRKWNRFLRRFQKKFNKL